MISQQAGPELEELLEEFPPVTKLTHDWMTETLRARELDIEAEINRNQPNFFDPNAMAF